jgi:hypothetical protein
MAIVAVFEFPDASVHQYEKVFEVGGAPILEQPSRRYHVCYRTDTGFVVVDVWDDEQSFASFGEVIGPALQSAGLNGGPVVHPLQGIITQAGKRSK